MHSKGIKRYRHQYTEEIGEAAFYGPKLDVNVKPAIGKMNTRFPPASWISACRRSSTLTYTDSIGTERHRSFFTEQSLVPGSFHGLHSGGDERKPAALARTGTGKDPSGQEWDEELNAYSQVYKYLEDNGIRVEIDERNVRSWATGSERHDGKKFRIFWFSVRTSGRPHGVYRLHGEQQSTTVSMEDFLAMLQGGYPDEEVESGCSKINHCTAESGCLSAVLLELEII